MTHWKRSGVSSDPVAKWLLYSGLIFCVVGSFLVLLVNSIVGAVFFGCGLFDLAMWILIPLLRDRYS